MTDRHARSLLLGCFAVAAVIFVLQISPESHDGRRGPMVSGDGRYYYLVLRSAVLDHDLDFTNDYSLYGNWYFFGRTQAGRPANVFGVGPAVAWFPFFAMGHLTSVALHAVGAQVRTDGMGRIDQAFTLAGSFVYVALAVWLAYRLARRFFPPWPSLLGAVGAWLGGPLLWYQIWECSYAHAMEAAAAAALVLAWATWCEALTPSRWILIGALAGALVLMRPQQIVFVSLPAIDWLWTAWVRKRGEILGPLLGITTAALVFAPQMLMWHAVYGRWLVVPQGTGFMRFSDSLWQETLFSSRNGLFTWAPLWAAGVVGLVVLARRSRRQPPLWLAIFVGTAWTNGAAWDWWGGGAYGGRRFAALLPLITVGIAALAAATAARTRVVRLAAGLMFTGVLFLQLAFLNLYRSKAIPWDVPLPAARTWGQLLGAGGRAFLRRFGNPLSWPASLPFAFRYRVSPVRYEELVGPYLLDERVPTTNPRRMGRRKEVLSLANSRYLVAPGRMLIPLNRTGRLGLRITGSGSGEVRWNGKTLHTGTLPVLTEIAAADVRRGLNQLEVRGAAEKVELQESSDWPPSWSTKDAP
jgi:hypothetical protein